MSDFDGTITNIDALYKFFDKYASDDWTEVEKLWINNEISSKECLIRELNLVPNLSESLIDEYVNSVKIDEYFVDFYNFISNKGIDFAIVSDGIDYFIDKILNKYGLKNIKIISNHGEFINGKFELIFPNDSNKCKNNAGTCKCEIVEDYKNKFEQILYIGDGISDFCVSNKVDYLFAKSKLIDYCEKNNINYSKFNNFKDILNNKTFNLI